MLMYRPEAPSHPALDYLARQQARIDAAASRADRIALAQTLFSRKHPRWFDEIRHLLAQAVRGDACCYCERDRYRDIDHVRPKRHYPEHCFQWANFVLACAICNQDRKRDRFAVINDHGQLVEFDRRWPPDRPVPAGQEALIDIRHEDPLLFLVLDFETGRFSPTARPGTANHLRATFTCVLLDLNNDVLARARRQCVIALKDYLTRHRAAVRQGRSEVAARIRDEISGLPHPTVLVEMLRQRNHHYWLPPLIDPLPAGFGRFADSAHLAFD